MLLSGPAEAQQYRGSGNNRIGSIGALCGFENPETFTRAFQRQFGMTPTELRQTA